VGPEAPVLIQGSARSQKGARISEVQKLKLASGNRSQFFFAILFSAAKSTSFFCGSWANGKE
jgi:hypothetical protein